jgi:AcrR family transcriptional regulator
MARPAKFSTEQILETAAHLVAEGGPTRATVTNIAERIGAPTGSIYHRFVSRDLLLAQLWVRTARRAQAGFIEALADEDLDRAVANAARHIPRWARENIDDAIVMLLYRREDLAERWPEAMGDEVVELGASVQEAIRSFTRRWYGSASRVNVEAVTFALLDIPYASTRRHLSRGERPPSSAEPLVERAARAVLSRN